jgi:hypothetical protein
MVVSDVTAESSYVFWAHHSLVFSRGPLVLHLSELRFNSLHFLRASSSHFIHRTKHAILLVYIRSHIIPQFGLVAEQVEKVNSDLVVRDEDGKVSTVRYEAVNAMLLNEFLKEHRNVEEQKAGLAEMRSVVSNQEELITMQQKQIEALAAGLQKVSAAVELNKRAPTQVADNR